MNTKMMMMSYFCGMLLLIFALASLAAGEDNPLLELLSNRDEVVHIAGYGEEKLSTVLITGSVHCEAPHQPHAWPLQGVWVGVKCHSHGRKWKWKSSMVARGESDEFGEFIVELPSHLHAIPNLEKVCSVKIHRIPEASCRPGRVKKPKGLSLSSFGNGIRTYNAGNIRIQHAT
ncbi:unnamed protein product [Sphenostylis stenocarpa]|uniref:Uncharacterized protein n=1 Tax=Sphenostylis stenocarpa TaxID=92480 RepID=A0AA86SIM7_9FABA|nr:unnamed protein product [Sphenostylis stenocarpa]